MSFLNVKTLASLLLGLWLTLDCAAQQTKPRFRVLAFYTAKNDQAHISYVQEANKWFPKMAAQHGFAYDSTSNWDNLNAAFLAKYQVVLFLDTRPEAPAQRAAFQQYMEQGGAWLGFHFAGFALTPSTYAQDWNWYHEQFLGTGQYAGNTWRPTAAVLRVANTKHPTTRKLPPTFTSAPNEWYKWTNDLRTNPAIDILLAVDSTSFPLGTGPKAHEIWRSGYYPVAWTNRRYRMVYVNMGHNDIDYEHGTNQQLSSTFSQAPQNQFILNTLLWLGKDGKYRQAPH
ncbi:ThuA domain-containing protein [Hymenobacter cellulosilyticus]|uniref:ThuA domain-containing protein n=1 Tax=Hymenobacter cellulosilyticus TaxID=2932248 RepID=A0A8T9Q063_9BACT|nr:ThuA domain-containing protein [Hymenobacter cellulosilyticus]UOQ70747.1 ThuA domain-containing protein [Hymenobacter cellulosilyticus]